MTRDPSLLSRHTSARASDAVHLGTRVTQGWRERIEVVGTAKGARRIIGAWAGTQTRCDIADFGLKK